MISGNQSLKEKEIMRAGMDLLLSQKQNLESRLEDQVKEYELHITLRDESLAELQDQLQAQQKANATNESEKNDLHRQLLEHQRELNQLHQEKRERDGEYALNLRNLEKELSVKEEQMEEQNAEFEKERSAFVEKEEEMGLMNNQLEEEREVVKESLKSVEELKMDKDGIEVDMKALVSEREEFMNQQQINFESHQKEIKLLNQTIADKEEQMEMLNEIVRRLKEGHGSVTDETGRLRDELVEMEKQMKERDEVLVLLEKEGDDKVKKLEADMQDMQQVSLMGGEMHELTKMDEPPNEFRLIGIVNRPRR